MLNQTKLIFIGTTLFWDNISYSQSDMKRFHFLWKDKKLYNTLFLNTRTMRGLYSLYDEKDYFSKSLLSAKIAKYLIFDSKKIKRIRVAEYFFNFG